MLQLKKNWVASQGQGAAESRVGTPLRDSWACGLFLRHLTQPSSQPALRTVLCSAVYKAHRHAGIVRYPTHEVRKVIDTLLSAFPNCSGFYFPLHFDQAKAKEEKLKKCGEDEETVPSEYRLKPATVRR